MCHVYLALLPPRTLPFDTVVILRGDLRVDTEPHAVDEIPPIAAADVHVLRRAVEKGLPLRVAESVGESEDMDEVVARARRHGAECHVLPADEGLRDLPQRAVASHADDERVTLRRVVGGELGRVALGAREHHVAGGAVTLHHLADGAGAMGAVPVSRHGIHDEDPGPSLLVSGPGAAFLWPLPLAAGGFFVRVARHVVFSPIS